MNTKTINKNFRTDNPTFLMYKEWEELTDALDSMEEVGRLFKALFAYASRGEQPDFSGALKIAFLCISKQIDRDGEKWEEMCEKNKAVAAKRRNNSANKESKANKNTAELTSAAGDESSPESTRTHVKSPELTKSHESSPQLTKNNHKDKEEDKEEVNEEVKVKVNVNVEEEDNGKEKEKERAYGKHGHTLLTDRQYERLLSMSSSSSSVVQKYIDKYDNWLYTKNKRPANAYEVIKGWIEQDGKRDKPSYDIGEWEKMALGIDPNEVGFGGDDL